MSTEPSDGSVPGGDLKLGKSLGHFDLEEFVGGGGMGRVYRALDTGLNRKVALKSPLVATDRADREERSSGFANEARAAARLNHESIAHVYYFGEHEGTPLHRFRIRRGA